jgi:DNA-binding transcriptional MerR regulator
MAEQWIGIRELSQQAGVPESTVRRYLVIYDEFIQFRQAGRKKVYTPSTVALIKRINQLHADGHVVAEIKRALEMDENRVIATTPQQVTTFSQQDQPKEILLPGDFVNTHHEIATNVAAIQDQIAGLQASVDLQGRWLLAAVLGFMAMVLVLFVIGKMV